MPLYCPRLPVGYLTLAAQACDCALSPEMNHSRVSPFIWADLSTAPWEKAPVCLTSVSWLKDSTALKKEYWGSFPFFSLHLFHPTSLSRLSFIRKHGVQGVYDMCLGFLGRWGSSQALGWACLLVLCTVSTSHGLGAESPVSCTASCWLCPWSSFSDAGLLYWDLPTVSPQPREL